jgi:hypothetical protein
MLELASRSGFAYGTYDAAILIDPSFPWCSPYGGIGMLTQEESSIAEIIVNDSFIFFYLYSTWIASHRLIPKLQ